MKGIYLIVGIIAYYALSKYLLGIKPVHTPDEYVNWALALLAINLIPSLHYLMFRRKNVPFIPLVGLFYALAFAIPVFFIELGEYQLGDLNVNALKFSFFALTAFYSTYYIAFAALKKIRGFEPVKDNLIENNRFLRTIMYAFLVIAITGKLFPGSELKHFYDPAVYIFAGIYLFMLLKKKLTIIEIVLLASVILVEFGSRFAVSLLSSSAKYMLFLTMIYYLVKRRLPVAALVISILVYSLLLPVKMEFRRYLESAEGELSTRQRLELFYVMAKEHYLESKKTERLYGRVEQESPFWRFSYSASALSRVMDMTPGVVPYWNGHTYATLYSKFIPRFLWPGKPTEDIGQEFGHRYNILDENDIYTSMNLPWMAELYANWGRTALIGGMAIFGLLFGFIDRFYNSTANMINTIISAAIYFPVITHESNFALEAGNIFLLTVALHFFAKFVSRNFKSITIPSP